MLNPPLLGTLAGVVVGMSPLGPLLFSPGSATAASLMLHLPGELQVRVSAELYSCGWGWTLR